MGRQGRGKKPEKLGTGRVTPIQVAFIVDRYLTENQYNKTLTEFRSEAASVLGITQARQAPKSMLSLVDILDDYITLKEQRMLVDQEKARMDQLLHGMQDIIFAYQSGAMLPATTSTQFPAASSPIASSQAEVTPPLSGPYPIPPTSAAANTVVASRSVMPMERTNSTPLANNKRKLSNSLPDPSISAKKACPPAHPTSSFSCEKVNQGLQVPANGVCRQSQAAQAASHTSTSPQLYPGNCPSYWGPTYSLPMPTVQHDSSTIAKTLYNHPSPSAQGRHQFLQAASQMPNDSSCPQTPPQAFSIQADTSASPLEASSMINGNASLAHSMSMPGTSVQEQKKISDEPIANPEVEVVEIRSAEKNFDSSTTLAETPKAPSKDRNSGSSSPSKGSSRKAGKRGNIKGRLDFNNSVASTSRSPIKSSANPTTIDFSSTCHASAPNEEIDGGQFDLADIPPLDADFDKLMSDFLVDFELHSEGLACGDIASMDQSHENSSIDENQRFENLLQNSENSESTFSKVTGILTEKDMNLQVPATVKANDVTNCSKSKSHFNSKGGKIKDVANQENVPMLI
eukprot:Gb_22009 [translate_table: standard]